MNSALSDASTSLQPKQIGYYSSETGAELLHVVGLVTDEVFSFMGPATRALDANGHVQRIVVIDSPEHRHNVEQFDQYATVIRIENFSDPMRRWRNVFRVCREQFAANETFGAVHVHGLLPFLIISMALRSSNIQAPVVYSPHGSRSLGTLRFVGKLAMLAAHSVTKHGRSSAIVTVPREVDAFDKWKSTAVVENPVAEVFFSTSHIEAMKPLIVTGGRQNSMRSVEIFSQLAVLLSGEELGLDFNWLGTVSEAADLRLRAASVVVTPITGYDECALHMASGWMYVAPWSTRGFPLFLVQAMAAGLPCVALDCVQHREVIEDGKTGFLCANEQEMVSKIATLVDNKNLRSEMGAAARVMARARFDESDFQDKLLTAYSTKW